MPSLLSTAFSDAEAVKLPASWALNMYSLLVKL